MMNTQRAQEIVESPVMVDVTYNGKQIYIQHVDQQNDLSKRPVGFMAGAFLFYIAAFVLFIIAQ